MKITKKILKEVLVKNDFVPQESFDKAVQASLDLDQPLVDVLVFRGLVAEESLNQLLAEYFKVPYINLKHKILPLEVIGLIPEELARRFRMIPFAQEKGELSLALENPTDIEAIELVKRKTGLKIKPFFTSPASLRSALSQYKKNIKKEFDRIIGENLKKAGRIKGTENLSKAALVLPVVKILDTILQYAIAEKASDIHIESMVAQVVVRFRVDGILRDIISLPKTIGPAIVARIKILSFLKIDEHRIPQDGRFKFSLGEREKISLRVSILPALNGENVVLRLLFESTRPLNLEELGFHGKNFDILQAEMKEPNGMILVTGPTGCGKTTTLYSILNILNSIEVKICTVEDPIEYGIHRVSQTQINPKSGLTFAAGLRSLLRHDPDIIMVGEIRDKETAEIAVHAALTGHLVLSTLHTNDAPSAIPRLLDMGVERYLLASTVNLIIAQRLVRRICSRCVKEYTPTPKAIERLKKELGVSFNKNQVFYKGEGCQECGQTGYKGRIGIFEIFQVNTKLRELILKNPSAEEIRKTALKEGMISMLADGVDRIAAGETTLEEVLRVIKE